MDFRLCDFGRCESLGKRGKKSFSSVTMQQWRTVVPVFISVFSSTEIVGMHHCEIGIVQTQIEKQIFTNTIAADASCNT